MRGRRVPLIADRAPGPLGQLGVMEEILASAPRGRRACWIFAITRVNATRNPPIAHSFDEVLQFCTICRARARPAAPREFADLEASPAAGSPLGLGF